MYMNVHCTMYAQCVNTFYVYMYNYTCNVNIIIYNIVYTCSYNITLGTPQQASQMMGLNVLGVIL